MRLIETTTKNFKNNVTCNPRPVMLRFWAPWCGPCRMMRPVFEELAAELAGRISFQELNIEECQEIGGQFAVSSIPSFLFFSRGELVDRMMGAAPKSALESFIEQNLPIEDEIPSDETHLALAELDGRMMQSSVPDTHRISADTCVPVLGFDKAWCLRDDLCSRLARCQGHAGLDPFGSSSAAGSTARPSLAAGTPRALGLPCFVCGWNGNRSPSWPSKVRRRHAERNDFGKMGRLRTFDIHQPS